MKKAVVQFLLFLCLSVVFGCASSQESRLIGKWVCKASDDRMELLGNHTCTVYSMGFQYMGTWAVSKSDIKIETREIVMNGSFDGKNIVAEDAIMHNKYVFEKAVETKR